MRIIDNIYFKSGLQLHTQTVNILDDASHRHTFFELFYITKGEIDHTVNGVSKHIVAGDMFLLRPNDVHCFNREFGNTCEHRDVLITPEQFKKICDFISPSFYQYVVEKETPLFARLNQFELSDFEKDFSVIQYTPNIFLSNYTISPTNAIATKLLYKFLQYARSKQPKIPDWIYELAQKMSAPESFNLDVNDLLIQFNYNPSYASRMFKKYMGVSLVTFFLTTKINYAMSLLQFSDKPITDIAIQSGFSSLSYFNRVFKSLHGISPREYRKSFS